MPASRLGSEPPSVRAYEPKRAPVCFSCSVPASRHRNPRPRARRLSNLLSGRNPFSGSPPERRRSAMDLETLSLQPAPVDPAASAVAVLLPESYVSQLLSCHLHVPVAPLSTTVRYAPAGASAATPAPAASIARQSSGTAAAAVGATALGAVCPEADAASGSDACGQARPLTLPAMYDVSRQIYCQGELLHVVQTAHLFADSKTFVDMRLKFSPEETLEQFEMLMQQTGRNPSRDQVQQFVNDYFESGKELEETEIPDWVERPQLLSRILDPNLREWASDLNAIWKNLSRKVSEDVRDKADHYSLIYVPNHFVVPGGRFRELYYWDTYWIVRGLLLSDMRDTVRGILDNFMYLLDNYGIIPNGGRIYYLQRSQPPLLAPMVYTYYVTTKDLDFVRKNIHLMEKEFDFWMNNRTVRVSKDGSTYTLVRYYALSEGPRPESYREDFVNGKVFTTDERKREFYIDLKSAAESGWDFSSRWFIKDGVNKGNLTDIHTKDIIPVDINAYIYAYADILSKLHSVLGNAEKATMYAQTAHQWREAVAAILWNEEEGIWFDYDMSNEKQRKFFYPSNISPLWTKCYDQKKTAVIAEKVVKYLENTEILKDYLGGIPTSLNNTGEQWDLPNAWPPLQSIIIQGLEDTKYPRAQEMAFDFAKNWVRSNYKGFREKGEMHEKYDAENPGSTGGGGEYDPQSGFGWTNGVVLELLNSYGDRLTTGNNVRVPKSVIDILKPAQ